MLKVGIIGCGTIAQVRHIPEYAANENCEIAAYYDIKTETAEKMAAKYGGKVYTDLEELLHSGVDAVSVCVANAMHASISIRALEAGLHVLCEKPMAVTLEECEAMAEAAKQNNRKLMIGQNQRFAQAHIKARELIRKGAVGKVLSFDTRFEHSGPEAWSGQANPWFFDKKRSVFGAMADLGVHKTDLIHYLLGEPITKVSAILSTVDKRYPDGTLISVDDNAYCIYQTKSGVTGTMHVSWTQYGEECNSTIIQGSEGMLRCYTDSRYTLILERKGGETEKFELDTVGTNEEQTSGKLFNSGVIDRFADCIIKDTVPPSSGEEALKAMRVVFAAEKSSQTGEVIEVKY
ncbi:Gfo/Idh/MocA family protein [Sporofaciens musculi]|uniref:Gfo/Idh/MocA family protein n=1 Tax=Sporofaciens musculi TaxID=2681861 RepID=UPI00256FB4B6|nr:Gfo/Idh/MocA family oxidoreductase [Sporofaciens musculi]